MGFCVPFGFNYSSFLHFFISSFLHFFVSLFLFPLIPFSPLARLAIHAERGGVAYENDSNLLI
jgi:hypothetical protein